MPARVLSYNMFWKSMVGQIGQCPIRRSGLSACAERIGYFINYYGPYDFVCLQEASRWEGLVRITPVLSEMNVVSYKPGPSPLITLYSNKYTLDPTCHTLKGFSTTKGRPFTALFFTNKLCLINLHADHGGDAYNFQQTIERWLSNLRPQEAEQFFHKFRTYQIIMAGDMNNQLHQGLRLFGRQLYGQTIHPTCCDTNLQAETLSYASDHVLSTVNQVRTEVFRVTGASDHLPIISQVQIGPHSSSSPVVQFGSAYRRQKNIAYDFDGVLHRAVRPANTCGERMHYGNEIFEPFTEILNKIKIDILNGSNVFIITARSPRMAPELHRWIADSSIGYLANKINYNFTSGRSKLPLIYKHRINIFYDDSCRNITEIHENRDKLVDLEELYFVNPEERTWTLVTDSNIANLCPKSSNPIKAAFCDLAKALGLGLLNITSIISKSQTLVKLYPALLLDEEVQRLLSNLEGFTTDYQDTELSTYLTQYAIAKRLISLQNSEIELSNHNINPHD